MKLLSSHRNVPRRALVTVPPLLLASCTSHEEEYLGNTMPPSRQRLVYGNGVDPESFDPATYAGGTEMRIISALFEGLTQQHPVTLEPMAALATHWQANAAQTQFTFYLRGHAAPRGIRLPNTDTLRHEYHENRIATDYARGHHAPPDHFPARWTDGTVITAHDFVYSWKRVVAPATGSSDASFFRCIENAEDILKGRKDASLLGVCAIDDFALRVHLHSPAPYFLALQSQRAFSAVPRQAIEAAIRRGRDKSWTLPEYIVTSGPFLLRQRRANEKVVLAKNPNYYEADVVSLEEIVFLPVRGMPLLNLYKVGELHAHSAGFLPPLEMSPVIRTRKDYHSQPILSRYGYVLNTTKPPFDNVLLRYALNMSIDKQAIAAALADSVALGCVPPQRGYPAPASLPLKIDCTVFDVLAFNPPAAKALLAKAGYPNGIGRDGKRLVIPVVTLGDQADQIVQSHWMSNLNIEVTLVRHEFNVWIQNLLDLSYDAVAHDVWGSKYRDPNSNLEIFLSNATQSGTGWTDPRFDAMLAQANATLDPSARMRKLARCEEFLLTAMPLIPVAFQVASHLQKPYLRGFEDNVLEEPRFKYAWIDTNWRPN